MPGKRVSTEQKVISNIVNILRFSFSNLGVHSWADGPNGSAIDGRSGAFASATTGKAGVQFTWYGGEVEEPSAAAGVLAGDGGYGAFTEASLGRVEGNMVFASARLEPNLNTGVGVRDGTFELNVLGFGFQVGRRGIGINTALGGVNLFGS